MLKNLKNKKSGFKMYILPSFFLSMIYCLDMPPAEKFYIFVQPGAGSGEGWDNSVYMPADYSRNVIIENVSRNTFTSIMVTVAGQMLVENGMVVGPGTVGILAGIIPAYQASKLKPVEALRYE